VRPPSDPVVKPAVWGTAAFVIAALVGIAAPDPLAVSIAVFDLLLFVLGTLAFLRTLLTAAQRSREEELSVAGIWFLQGSAPAQVQRWLLGALVGIGAAIARPDPLAFGTLVPVFGLGMSGLWAVRSGTFPPRRSTRSR
jgi:hypothetical protein